VCSSKLVDTLTYTQVSGIIAGQLFIGFIADKIGRKWGSVMNAAIMLVCE
jgi:MFS family permease